MGEESELVLVRVPHSSRGSLVAGSLMAVQGQLPICSRRSPAREATSHSARTLGVKSTGMGEDGVSVRAHAMGVTLGFVATTFKLKLAAICRLEYLDSWACNRES